MLGFWLTAVGIINECGSFNPFPMRNLVIGFLWYMFIFCVLIMYLLPMLYPDNPWISYEWRAMQIDDVCSLLLFTIKLYRTVLHDLICNRQQLHGFLEYKGQKLFLGNLDVNQTVNWYCWEEPGVCACMCKKLHFSRSGFLSWGKT